MSKKPLKILSNFFFSLIILVIIGLTIAISEKILNLNLNYIFYIFLTAIIGHFIFESFSNIE